MPQSSSILTTPPASAPDWRAATVDVVIPALNEQANIVRCLASLRRQTLQPRHIVVVDDGSHDDTALLARAFADVHGGNVFLVIRGHSIGKAPSVTAQARTLESDVLFVLDADTILDSDNYIERTVQELYRGSGIASACGSILPLREEDRRTADGSADVRKFADATPWYQPQRPKSSLPRLASAVARICREVVCRFLFRIIANPGRCAVAYRRVCLERLFDCEDIFIGLARLNEGVRNVQVIDVCARTSTRCGA